jgi:hypothetical protein
MKTAPALSRKPWHPDTLDGIAQTPAEYGLVPADALPASGRSPEDGQPEELERLLVRVEEAGEDACRPLVVRLSRTGLGVAAHGGFCLDSALWPAGPENRVRAVFSRVPQALQ